MKGGGGIGFDVAGFQKKNHSMGKGGVSPMPPTTMGNPANLPSFSLMFFQKNSKLLTHSCCVVTKGHIKQNCR